MTTVALDQLTACVTRVVRGPGLAVEVVGEPGIGKSHLLDAFAGAAAGARVRRAAAYPDVDRPGAVLAEALDPHLDGGPVEAGGLAELLGRLAGPGGLVLLLDDLHWADPTTTAVLADLVRAGVPGGVLLVLAHRPGPEPPAWAGDVDERVSLGPLDAAAAAPLLAHLPAEDRPAVLDRSGGNPCHLLHLARAGDAAAGPPPAVVDAVAAEVDALPAAARLVVRGAALAGDPVDPTLAAAAAGLPDVPSPAALTATMLLRRDPDGAIRFRSPVVREAVYAGAGPVWRLGAHERVDAALAAAAASPEQRAPHVERYARPGNEDALGVLTAAAVGSLTRAPAAASRWYAAALRLVPNGADQRRVDLLAVQGVALGASGRLVEARRTLRALTDRDAAVPPAAVAFLALVEGLLGRHRDTPAVLTAALASAAPGTSDAAHLQAAVAEHALRTGAPAAALGAAVAARSAARAGADPALLAFADVLAALAELAIGRVEGALVYAGAAVTTADALPDDGLAGRLPVLMLLSRFGALAERFADGARHGRRGLELAHRTDQRHLMAALGTAVVTNLVGQGRLAEATEAAALARKAAVEGHELARALTATGRVALATGDVRRAVACAQEAGAAAAGLDPDDVAVELALLRAEAGMEAGEPARCRAELPAACGGPDLPLVGRPDRAGCYELLARAALAVVDIPTATEWADRAEAAVLALPLPGRTAAALRARAAVELAAGRPAQAAEVAEAALAALATDGMPVATGRTGILAARALAAAGDRRLAVTRLTEAHACLRGCGARRAADEAAQLLRSLGHRGSPRSGDRAEGGGLSARELEIAELVATGLTNREIAEALFVSEKTVESHLGATFRKLAVRSRTAVAAALRSAPGGSGAGSGAGGEGVDQPRA